MVSENKPRLVLWGATIGMLLLNSSVFLLGLKTGTQATVALAIFGLNSIVCGLCGWIGGRRELSVTSSLSLILLLVSWWGVWGQIWLKSRWLSTSLSDILSHRHVEFIIIYSLANTICFFFCYVVGEDTVLEAAERAQSKEGR